MPPSQQTEGRTERRKDTQLEIIDIRQNKIEVSLKDEILAGLKKDGEKALPTLLLYNEQGLKLFEEITYLDEYYLTNTEIEILERYAENMAERIEDDSIIVELGSGNLRKVNILLRALDNLGKKVTYYALDLARSELVRTLAAIPEGTFKNVRCIGLLGTYEDGRAWLRDSPTIKHKTRCVLWLGSSAGNFSLSEIADFLRGFSEDTLRPGRHDSMIVGLDGCKDGLKVGLAYDDPKGITRDFILNGLNQANGLLGGNYFVQGDWKYISEWNAKEGRHQAYYEAAKDTTFAHEDLKEVSVAKGERIHIEYSYKFGDIESRELWARAGLSECAQWSNISGDYCLHMLCKPNFFFEKGSPGNYAGEPVPSLKEWKELWAAWDTVTLGMIPKDKLLAKPIDLRNPCIFYLGHVPAFLDFHITHATKGKLTPPAERFQEIFQRGIDPDVDNPEQCHPHSAVPEQWPAQDQILEFANDVRDRVTGLYDSQGKLKDTTTRVQRALWLCFEHEAMHLETLLYMLVQSEDTLPPPGVIKPDFVSGRTWERRRQSLGDNSWHTIPKSTINVGMHDPEGSQLDTAHYFGWDNEKPIRTGISVSGFKIRAYPITNEEYAKYLYETSATGVPASWKMAPKLTNENSHNEEIPNGQPRAEFEGYFSKFMRSISVRTVFSPASWKMAPKLTNGHSHNGIVTKGQPKVEIEESFSKFMGSISVRTVFGPVPVKLALDWPVMASYDELNNCIKWMGGRIPAANELRSAHEFIAQSEMVSKKLTKKIDAVNGHLNNNGVQESPPPEYSNELEEQRANLFQDLSGVNVGFENWHPTSVRCRDNTGIGNRCGMGGAWEWTSTVLESHDGFKPDSAYPEYTADFFDGKHNLVLGGGWATHPRIAGRKSFVNWYQRNYRYTWCTARIIKSE